MQNETVFGDRKLRKIVVGCTGLAVAFLLGSLASLQVSQGVGFRFGWHWALPVVVLAGVVWNWKFWQVVWQIQDGAVVNGGRKLLFYIVCFAALGIGSFLYPVQFLEQARRTGVLEGLAIASVFLGILGFLLYRAGKMFQSIDEIAQK